MDGNMEGMSWEEMVCAGLEDQKPPKKKKRIRKTQHNPNGIVKTKR